MRVLQGALLALPLYFSTIVATKPLQLPTEAVTVVPVADLLLQRMATVYPEKNIDQAYANISLEGKKASTRSCPRVHQLLFNEQITIIQEKGGEVLVEIPHLFYTTAKNKNRKYNRYWSHKKNFIPLADITSQGIGKQFFPKPISFKHLHANSSDQTVTLLFPFYDPKSSRNFSAGTRFVLEKNGNTVIACAYNPNNQQREKITIPKQLCLIGCPKQASDKRKQFVNVLRGWANTQNGFVPYVWGGCSFTKRYKKNMIETENVRMENGNITPVFTQRKDMPCCAGFDCTGAIARAAHMAGIPYFFKNSSTATQHLATINRLEDLSEGDLFYFGGHMMIISDITHNKIIEARTHEHGFGQLHEASLEKIFKGVQTYKQLAELCHSKETLLRLNRFGNVVEQIKEARFLKLTV